MPIDEQNVSEIVESPVEPMSDSASETPDMVSQEAPVEEYVPNYKFKVHDKEHEFDEWIRGTVNKDNEAKVRELYEKAYGLDVIKPKYQQTKEEAKAHKAQLDKVMKGLQQLDSISQKKDIARLAEIHGLDRKDILKYAYEIARYEELAPEQKAAYDEIQRIKQENDRYKQQSEMLSQLQVQQLHNEHLQSLEQAVSRPEVAEIVKLYNERNGESAFQEMVRQRGYYMYQQTGRDPAEADVVDQLCKELGGFIRPSAPQAPAGMPIVTKTGAVVNVAQQTKKTLPSVKGGNQSVVEPALNSIEDLLKARKAKLGF